MGLMVLGVLLVLVILILAANIRLIFAAIRPASIR